MSSSDSHIPRSAKGKRPQYFNDPATDKLLNIVLSLAGELSVNRDRLDALERQLADSGHLDRDRLNGYQPSEAAQAERQRSRRHYLERVLRPVLVELAELDHGAARAATESLLKELTEN